MSTALEWISGDQPEHLEQFVLLIAQQKPDPYNPESLVDDWNQTPTERAFEGSWASGSSSIGYDAVRAQMTTTKTITIFDASVVVHANNRIRTADGGVYRITGKPERDRNPWTGWQPTLVVAVEEATG